MNRDETRLVHMLDAIAKIQASTANITYEMFIDCEEKIDAVLYNFMILGEALSQISPAFQSEHPSYPWKLWMKTIKGMRNLIVHDYVKVDNRMVWQTIKDDLPSLKQTLEGLYREL